MRMNEPILKQYAIPLLSLFVAFVALFVAIWQGVETRKHNHLSVIPHLDITIVSKEPESGKGGVRIINDGVGPAIIRSVKMFWKDELIIEDDESNYTKTKWLHLHKIFWPDNEIEANYLYPRPGAYIQPKRRIFALEVPVKQLHTPEIWCVLKHVRLEITYNDVYENVFSTQFNASLHPYFSKCLN